MPRPRPASSLHLTSTAMAAGTNGASCLLRLPTTATTSLQLLALLQLVCLASALNQDGTLLLSFKQSLAADPLGSLSGWGYADATPCAWNGVVCSPEDSRVLSVVLPNAQLVGPVAGELGLIEHLRHLDLSGNALSGTIPPDLLRAPELRVLSLAGNGITGGLPEQVAQLRGLRTLDLARNALSGAVPRNLTLLPNLTAVSLAGNFFSGALPGGGFPALQVLDVSANLLNGTLPPDFGGAALRYVNLSSNRISGAIPPEMASRLPANVTVDLSYNNLTGAIPAVPPFTAQRPAAFEGNAELCGRPLDKLCGGGFASSSAAVEPPNGAAAKSPPAIAAIPRDPTDALPADATSSSAAGAAAAASGEQRRGRMRLATVAAIAAGDVAGIAVLFVVVLYVYQVRKRRQRHQEVAKRVVFKKPPEADESPDGVGRSLSCCLRKKAGADDSDDTDQDVTDTSASFAANEGGITHTNSKAAGADDAAAASSKKKGGGGDGAVLVTVDGGAELELETLLKASAYILGAGGSSIVYKAVLADGAALAVRRIGSDCAGVRRLGELHAHMRAVAKLRHGNILRLRGFYWGPDEMLVIHDFAANGNLANLSVKRKPGSSLPMTLGWSARLRIARGVARGLAYLHDKKWVHGNVKPSNILLDADMEPLLADLGVDRLVRGAGGMDGGGGLTKPSTTLAGRFGSKRSAKSLPDLSPPPGSSHAGTTTASPGAGGAAPASAADATAAHYRAPEAARSPGRRSGKWDVYALGVLLLELVAGRALTSLELCRCAAAAEEPAQAALRVAAVDPALRGEMEGREDAVASCLRLGAACCAVAPGKRPSARDALLALERIPAAAAAAASSVSSASTATHHQQ